MTKINLGRSGRLANGDGINICALRVGVGCTNMVVRQVWCHFVLTSSVSFGVARQHLYRTFMKKNRTFLSLNFR